MATALDTTVHVQTQSLLTMADSIDRSADVIDLRIQTSLSTLQNLINGGGFEGIRARLLLVSLEIQRPTLEMWAKRLRAYAQRLRAAGEAIRLADQASTKAPTTPTADGFTNLYGITRDRDYKTLVMLEQQMASIKQERDTMAMEQMDDQTRLAELRAELADYDEVSGDSVSGFLNDLGEYIETRRTGRYNEMQQQINVLAERITERTVHLGASNQQIDALTQQIKTSANNIRDRIQDVGGGHEVLFYQRMDPVPTAQAGWCLKFVNDWRPDLKGGYGSARDLITATDPSIAAYRYQVDGNTNLADRVNPGDLVVYDRSQHGADVTHGHVAIVMESHEDYIIVKESSWGNSVNTWRHVDRSTLQDLTFIGQPPQ